MGDAPDYYNRVNEDLLAMIPPSSSRVLEVGCGAGALATRFKRINPRCEYWGVEPNHEAASQADTGGDLDQVYAVGVEDFFEHAPLDYGRFQSIVMGDVLEHLEDPGRVLKRLVNDWLDSNGSIVACVPNVQHWSVIQTLLDGHWPQMDEGLFDRTHLRWFTRNSLVEMFKEAGLTIAKIVPRNLAPGGERVVKGICDAGLVEDPKRFAEESRAFQWLIHAVKGEIPSRKVLVRGFAAEACCARPRLAEPGAFINTVPGFRYSQSPTEVQRGESVVAIRQRFNITEAAVRDHLKHGHLIVGEWDDDPWYEGFRDRLKVPSVEWALKACHAVTVSTEPIAELVRPINPNVAVFPNQIAAVGPKREYVDSDVVRVYMGGQRRREDWADAARAVNGITAASPDRYDFVVVHDRDLYEALETKHKTFYAFQPYEKYRALLRTCDVAILALADSRFNRCKSDITKTECGAERTHAFMCWDDAQEITALFRRIGERKHGLWLKGGRDFEYVINNRMLCDHYLERRDQYNEWLDRKSELDHQLFDRLPELKEASNG